MWLAPVQRCILGPRLSYSILVRLSRTPSTFHSPIKTNPLALVLIPNRHFGKKIQVLEKVDENGEKTRYFKTVGLFLPACVALILYWYWEKAKVIMHSGILCPFP